MTSAEQLRTAVTRYQTARPAVKEAMRDSATALAAQLATERDALVTRIEKRWAWLDESNTVDLGEWTVEKHHPRFDEREDALLADIRQYEAIEDALREAAAVLLEAA